MRHRAPYSARLRTVPRRAESSRVALHLVPIPFPSFSVPSLPRAATLRARSRLSIPHPPVRPILSHPIPSDRPTDRPRPRSCRYFPPVDGQLLTRVLLPTTGTPCSSFLSLWRDFDPARRISQTCLSLPLSPFLFLSLTLGALLSLGEPPSLDICLPLSPCLNLLPPALVHPFVQSAAVLSPLRRRDGIQERLRD